jgi:hypothetical protein
MERETKNPKLIKYYIIIIEGNIVKYLYTKKQLDNILSYSKDKIEVIKL